MPGALTDKLVRVTDSTTGRPIITTLASGKAVAAASIALAAATNWTTTTKLHIAIYTVTAAGIKDMTSQTDWMGTLSGTTISNLTLTGGTDRSYNAGAYVEITPTARYAKDLYDWAIAQHKQDGSHADTITTNTINENTAANGVTIDGLNIKDNKLNTDGSVIPTNLQAGTGSTWAWTDYSTTSTITGWASTTTKQFFYKQHGKTVFFAIVISGTSNATTISLTLPVAASTHLAFWEGQVALGQDNGTITAGDPRWSIDTTSPSTLSVYGSMAGGGWTASGTKVIRITGCYEAA